jgi:hypothetical protein
VVRVFTLVFVVVTVTVVRRLRKRLCLHRICGLCCRSRRLLCRGRAFVFIALTITVVFFFSAVAVVAFVFIAVASSSSSLPSSSLSLQSRSRQGETDQVGGVRRPGRARQDNRGEVRRGGRSEGGVVGGPGKVR